MIECSRYVDENGQEVGVPSTPEELVDITQRENDFGLGEDVNERLEQLEEIINDSDATVPGGGWV